nr:hypothetical protein HK105_004915 [Polyrhizophydium stewartii]
MADHRHEQQHQQRRHARGPSHTHSERGGGGGDAEDHHVEDHGVKDHGGDGTDDHGGDGQGEMRELPESERQAILAGLRKSLDRVMVQHGKLPQAPGPASRTARREELERQMQELEADIEQLSVGGKILIRA